ncbi:tyrosine-protein phosphatase non-receptor type 20 isoform X1 [Monodelphis domestica]|uniref:tyrosine-protein phosphatase non-receptor type 20 isoform X1 n=1 Tax=Monodelphis domestica TaxID=13616 RepID=UPI000443525A|nr:tyrosine-protein phosphatase non-receptor type 20 isoform X1 [Monodelphis domestica]XP_007478641.1 tyrosine-protein phosphatase non-receptor type 20 isoform X1 [Monodelphis domestica]XP_007478642.1 tyrosine-protein phosphatase non-receptor type 20 isoform X1 [Monodelphis domestica]
MGSQVFKTKVNSQKVELCRQSSSFRIDYEDLLEKNSISIWRALPSFHSENWDNENEQRAGSSSSQDSPIVTSTGEKIITEEELIEISEIRPNLSGTLLRSTVRNLIEDIEKRIDQKEIFEEFLALENRELLDDCILGNNPENRDKNRYRDIIPYDRTRVSIGQSQDYINANYIRISNAGEEFFYIATQAPLPGTTEDFWQMVWENKSNVIAMITKEMEDGIIKCHPYWPISLTKPLGLQNFLVELENTQILEAFIIRVFKIVNKTGSVHFVHQIQFMNWPDHGIPTSYEAFVSYIRYMKKIHETGPIIAHCSAGIGRTGVLLCMDVVLHALENDLEFDIKTIVTQMRNQRCGMIQTKEQYQFCYETVIHVLRKIQTSARVSLE